MFRLIKLIFIWNILLVPFKAFPGSQSIDSLMSQLDSVLSKRDTYIEQKEAKLNLLRHKADTTKDMRVSFDVLGDLLDEYVTFNTDSAYSISLQREDIAKMLGDSVLVMNARMNRANILNATAMYKETIDLISSIKYELLPDYLRPYYFHIKRTAYGRLADFAAFPLEKKRYEVLTDMYRDSLLNVNSPTSLAYAITKADKLNANRTPHEAIAILDRYRNDNVLTEHDNAIFAWTLSESYSLIGDTDNQKRELIKSSISDIKSAVREYISLRQLALLLYREGDLERAYKFMSIAVDDAAKCNARQRIVELNSFYPMINDIYVAKIQSQKKSLSWTIVIIAILSLILLVSLVCTWKQMRKVSEARKTTQEANEKLHKANEELHDANEKLHIANEQLYVVNEELKQSNIKLHEANRNIAEISELKEVYIGRYMSQCLAYIDKLDAYRKSIGKLFGTGKTEELKRTLKSSVIIDDELKKFYEQFDQTFLSLFPTFVSDFNNLLLPGEEIIPKKEGYLNTELRIFALIRLGITDSDKIAKFLRYSLTTIYNYRTKVRNKAKGDRNSLEKEVMKIGLR